MIFWPMGVLFTFVDKKVKNVILLQKMHIFQQYFCLPRKLIFFLKIDTKNCANVYQSAWKTGNMFIGISQKMKWNLIFYRIPEILDFHILFHGRQ